LQRLVRLGESLPLEARHQVGEDAEGPPGDPVELLQVADQQRRDGGAELEDPVDQIHRPGLPEPRRLPPSHFLPLRRTRPLPTGNLEEPKILGVATLPGLRKTPTVLNFVGGFYHEQFVKLDYVNPDADIIQFGTYIATLNAGGKVLEGRFLGYGPDTEGI